MNNVLLILYIYNICYLLLYAYHVLYCFAFTIRMWLLLNQNITKKKSKYLIIDASIANDASTIINYKSTYTGQ